MEVSAWSRINQKSNPRIVSAARRRRRRRREACMRRNSERKVRRAEGESGRASAEVFLAVESRGRFRLRQAERDGEFGESARGPFLDVERADDRRIPRCRLLLEFDRVFRVPLFRESDGSGLPGSKAGFSDGVFGVWLAWRGGSGGRAVRLLFPPRRTVPRSMRPGRAAPTAQPVRLREGRIEVFSANAPG